MTTVDAFGEEMIAGRISCRGTMRTGSSTRRQKTLHRDGLALQLASAGERESPKDSLRLIMAFAWVVLLSRCRFHPPRIMPDTNDGRNDHDDCDHHQDLRISVSRLSVKHSVSPRLWTWAPFPVFHSFSSPTLFPFSPIFVPQIVTELRVSSNLGILFLWMLIVTWILKIFIVQQDLLEILAGCV